MFPFSKAKKKLQEAALNKFFASWLWGWYDGIARVLVPKKPKHGRLWGDWSLKNLKKMADSSGKVPFCVNMQCYSLWAEAFLVFDRYSQPTLHSQPTHYRHAAKSENVRKRQYMTVGRLSANSFWGELFFTFSRYRTHSNFNQISTWLIQIMKVRKKVTLK